MKLIERTARARYRSKAGSPSAANLLFSPSSGKREAAEQYADNWYARQETLDSGRTPTWTTGPGTARLFEAIATDSATALPASVVLDGEYGVHRASPGVPVELGRDGVGRVVEWDLTPGERRGMRERTDLLAPAATAWRGHIHTVETAVEQVRAAWIPLRLVSEDADQHG